MRALMLWQTIKMRAIKMYLLLQLTFIINDDLSLSKFIAKLPAA